MSYHYGNNTLQNTPVPNAKYKTMLCRHYQATKQCAIGSKCQFAHGAQEQRSIHDPLPASALSALTQQTALVEQKPYQQPSLKIPCKYHAMNYCKNGASCQYMHDPEPQIVQQQFQNTQTTYNPFMNVNQQQQLQQQQTAMLINSYQQEQVVQQPQKDEGVGTILLIILGNLEQVFPTKEVEIDFYQKDIIQQLKVAQDQVRAGNVQYGSDSMLMIELKMRSRLIKLFTIML
ncbi:hypothetical protein pb186bvf_008545 [Paramecium bursaria]